MVISGELKVGDEKFGDELDLSGMDEAQQERAVRNYILGMQATIMTKLNIGDYKS